jgi:hypothetical protein
MLAIQISVNVFMVLGAVIAAFGIGYMIRSAQVNSLRKKVLELESEMLRNHAEILNLQRNKASLEQTLKESKIPVIPMKGKEEDSSQQEAVGRKIFVAPNKS